MNVLRTDKDGNIVSQTGEIIQTKQQFLKQKVLGQNNTNKKITQQSKPLTLEQRLGGNVVSQPKINTTKDKAKIKQAIIAFKSKTEQFKMVMIK